MYNRFLSHRAVATAFRLTVGLAFAGSAFGSLAPSAFADPPAPVLHLTFDEGTGTTTGSDATAATLMGNATWGPGLVGAHALQLTGAAGGCAEIPHPVVDTTKSFTAMAWVRFHRLGGYQTLVSIDGDRVSGFFLQLRGDTGSFALTMPPISGTGEGGGIINAEDFEPDPNVWYHVAGVYDAAAHELRLYVNGTPQGTAPMEAPWHAEGPTAIGRGRFNGNPVDWTNGEIDDVRLYQSALSEADIKAIALANLPPAQQEHIKPATLTIDANRPGVRVNPIMNGLMTEEISHAYDGGLYAELIQNRAFLDHNALAHWAVTQVGDGLASVTLDSENPVSAALPHSLKLRIANASRTAPVELANDGYWGIPVRPNTTYRATFYAQASDGFSGPLTVRIQSADSSKVLAEGKVANVGGTWKQYSVTLKTGSGVTPSTANRFVISAAHAGTVRFSLVSLMPPTFNNRPNGTRIDLMQKQLAMRPGFLRMPGGNYLEGDTIATRFDWKKTIGPLSERPGHEGPWSYRSTDGMGLMEMLDWCDDLHMEPLLAVYAGYSLNHYRNPNPQRAAPGPALQPFVQDALDEIEFLIGDAKSTHWGAERARLGHPAPFKLHYVEIGNEDGFDESGSYDGRFAQFYDAIKAKYPQLQLIATAGGKDPVGIRQKVTLRRPDLIDEHYYQSPRAFERAAHQYDSYDRKGPKIFVGEWASQTGHPTPDMSSALGDAAWMTGMERNSDIVPLQSYAPLFVNINPGASQWGTNLIGYNALDSYVSPSYWVLQMFGTHFGDTTVPATLTGGSRLYESVTRDKAKGLVIVKLVNASGTAQSVRVNLTGLSSVAPNGTATVLSAAHPHDTNTLGDPAHIAPKTVAVRGLGKSFEYALPAYSVTVLEVRGR